MKRKTKRVIWQFLSIDYKAMEEYLEEMAKKGWMLEKLGHGIATFKKIQPSKLRFYIDVFKDEGPLTPENTSDSREYRSLCEDSGWHFITSQDYLQFFYVEEEQNPIPIQTDREMELSLVKRTILKGELLSFILLAFILRKVLYELFYTPYRFFISSNRMAMGLSLLIFIISNLTMIAYLLFWIIRSKKQLKIGKTIEPPSLKVAKIRAVIFHEIPTLAIFLAFVFLLYDSRAKFNEITFTLIIIALVMGAGSLLRYFIKKKGKRKDDGLYYLFIGTFIMLGFFALAIYFLWGVFMERDYNEEIIIPKDYPIVNVEELSEVSQRKDPWFEFRSDSSNFIPLSYDLRGGISGSYFAITYSKSKDNVFSELVFKGKTRELKKYLKSFRRFTSEVEKLKEDEELREKWQADQLILSEKEGSIVIRKGKHVLGIESHTLDFYKDSLIEYISNIYFLD